MNQVLDQQGGDVNRSMINKGLIDLVKNLDLILRAMGSH